MAGDGRKKTVTGRNGAAGTKGKAVKRVGDSKGFYVFKGGESGNKHKAIARDFVDESGEFILIGQEKVFYKTLKRVVIFDFGLDPELLHLFDSPERAVSKVGEFEQSGVVPFLFMEDESDGESNLRFLKYFKKKYPDMPVVVIVDVVDKARLLQFYEEGADHILKKTASLNDIANVIIHILRPQSDVDGLLRAAKAYVDSHRFEEAVRVADTVLARSVNNAAAFIIKGDALKGLGKRRAALTEYKNAEANSSMFIEPLKRLFTMYTEDNDKNGMLAYLVKLDDMSPLNFNRKIKVAELYLEMGNMKKAEKYFDRAIKAAESEAKTIVKDMSLDIADKLCVIDENLAMKYYMICLEHSRKAKDRLVVTTLSRLGISLRKIGRWEEAAEAYHVAEKFMPGSENVQYNLGLTYHDGRRFREALHHMTEALRINPKMYMENAEIAYNFGLVFKSGGKVDQAAIMIRRCLELNPKHARAKSLGLV